MISWDIFPHANVLTVCGIGGGKGTGDFPAVPCSERGKERRWREVTRLKRLLSSTVPTEEERRDHPSLLRRD